MWLNRKLYNLPSYILLQLITHFDCRVFTVICIFSTQMLQLGSPDLTWKCSIMSTGNPFIVESKCQGYEAEITVLSWVLTLV